jgi:hypothetical protein
MSAPRTDKRPLEPPASCCAAAWPAKTQRPNKTEKVRMNMACPGLTLDASSGKYYAQTGVAAS